MNATNPYAPPKGAVRDIDVSDSLEHAERITRLAAAFLDGIVFMAMVYLPALIAMAGGGAFAPSDEAVEMNQTLIVLGSVLAIAGLVAWIWLTILYVSRNGQSIAKKMLGIKVVRKDGSPASLGRIFLLRNVVNSLLGLIPLYALIDILLIFGNDRQCIHDKLADTIVVKA